MKIKNNFVLREIADEYIIVPVGSTTLNFNGMITVNDVGMYIWQQLQEEITEEELVRRIVSEYEVDEETASADLEEFLDSLKQGGIL